MSWSPTPACRFTIQRVTQFHDLVLAAMAPAARTPVPLIPAGTSCQPVHTADVAQRLAEIVRAGPAGGLAADLGRPQILDAAELADDAVAAIGTQRPVWPVWIPGGSVPDWGWSSSRCWHAAGRPNVALIP